MIESDLEERLFFFIASREITGDRHFVSWQDFYTKVSKSQSVRYKAAAKVPGARASRYRVYGVIGLHIGNYPKL